MTRKDLERQARGILDPLRSAPVALSSHRQLDAGRSEALSTLARLIQSVPEERAGHARGKRTQSRLRFALMGSLSIAVLTLVWFRVASGEAPAAPAEGSKLRLVQGQLSQWGEPLSVGTDYTIETLGRLNTRAGGAQFVTSGGVRVAIAPSSTVDLNFSARHRSIGLLQGEVALSVPRLERGTSLAVTTPDAVITVHGTRFSVEFRNGRTCVKVSEGVVSVARGADLEKLVAGRHSGCEPAFEASGNAGSTPSIAEQAESSDPAEARGYEAASKAPGSAAAGGTLTAENRLFERVLALEQARSWRDAETLAKRLLTRYPDSPLAPEARRALSRVRAERAGAGETRP